jgi:PIN domain nuclease of toxin-antitoxin system
MNPILLDTHAVIWAAENALKPELIRRVEAAAARSELLISPISAWEIGMLIRRERLSLSFAPEEYVRVLFSQRGVILAALTPTIALAAALLPRKPIADPADRILIATAMAYGAHLMTGDRRIQDYAKTTELRCIAC